MEPLLKFSIRPATPARSKVDATAAARAQRQLTIEHYERGQTGVWYYQVDIEVRFEFADSYVEDDVQFYAVRRRYTEFLQLYEKLKEQLTVLHETDPSNPLADVSELPPFPQKEIIPPSLLLLWRMSSSKSVLEERRAMFETLLRWIERHPILRESSAFVDFLGQPPQSLDGYVSLKEYTSQHWLSSLEQLTHKQKRRRRLSSDCSTCSVLLQERSRGAKKRRHKEPLERAIFKRQRRLTAECKGSPRNSPRVLARRRKRVLSRTMSMRQESNSAAPLLLQCDADVAARVESSPHYKKTKHL